MVAFYMKGYNVSSVESNEAGFANFGGSLSQI